MKHVSWKIIYQTCRNLTCLYLFLSQQELDCIVNQMMSVAENLGWDVSELKPVSIVQCDPNPIKCVYI